MKFAKPPLYLHVSFENNCFIKRGKKTNCVGTIKGIVLPLTLSEKHVVQKAMAKFYTVKERKQHVG